MDFAVSTLQKLAKENKELRNKLATAEQWIGRELSGRVFRKMKTETTRQTQQELVETAEAITERCQKYLGNFWEILTEEEKELLVESEINFYHLVRQKDIDGLIVTNAYQKILESIFERYATVHFRDLYEKSRLHPNKNDVLEKTLYKVLQQKFHLSLGKLYLILKQSLEENPPRLVRLYYESLQDFPIFHVMDDDIFWEFFTDIIETGAFGEKRHNGKITLTEVRLIREKIVGNFEKDGILTTICRSVAG